MRSDVVTLYGGAKYHLYRYKKYTDVRLVWAPETAAAFFGGDADNFEYPRYCLDVALFRVYEDDQPAEIKHYLKYAAAGADDGELVFVSGNPGRTQRIFTVAALKYLRDTRMPYTLNVLRRLEILLQQYGYEGDEQQRRARDELFGIQNARKAYTGMLQGLQAPAFMASKQTQEQALLERLRRDPQLTKYAEAWKTIAEVQTRRAEILGQTASFSRSSHHYDIAETLNLMAVEDQKASEDRLREYRDSARESLEQQLFSPAPIYDDLEIVKLADGLAEFVERRGGDDPLVVRVLAGKSPRERAAELVEQTTMGDVDVRRQLAAGGQAAIDASDDPFLQLAKQLEAEYRRVREIGDELDELERQAYAQITEATVAVQGTSTYPDATFTLRLAFGTVQGYIEDGRPVPPWTTLGGAFTHEQAHGAKDDWTLPSSWHQHREQLEPADASQLCLHRGHHWRQFGQPGDQPQCRIGRRDFRRQHSVADRGLSVFRRHGSRGLRSFQRHSRGTEEDLWRRIDCGGIGKIVAARGHPGHPEIPPPFSRRGRGRRTRAGGKPSQAALLPQREKVAEGRMRAGAVGRPLAGRPCPLSRPGEGGRRPDEGRCVGRPLIRPAGTFSPGEKRVGGHRTTDPDSEHSVSYTRANRLPYSAPEQVYFMSRYVLIAVGLLVAFGVIQFLQFAVVMVLSDQQTNDGQYFALSRRQRAKFRSRIQRHAKLLTPMIWLLSKLSTFKLKDATFRYQDVPGPKGACDEASFARGAAYRPQPEDVFVVTQMKCGTTWMQNLVYQLVTRGQHDLTLSGAAMYGLSPWLESRKTVSTEQGLLLGQQRPTRIIKTHFPVSLCPYDAAAKYIYVVRHPVSCFASCVDFIGSNLSRMAPPLEACEQWFCSLRHHVVVAVAATRGRLVEAFLRRE